MAFQCVALKRVGLCHIRPPGNNWERLFTLTWTRNFYNFPAHCSKQENEQHTQAVKKGSGHGLPFSSGEIAQIAEMRAKAHTYKKIGVALGRSEHAIAVKAAAVGIATTRGPRKIWTPADLAEMAQMREKGHTYRQIGEALSRSTCAVTLAAVVHGIASRRCPYTQEEDDQIRNFTAGMTRIPWKKLQEQMPHRSKKGLAKRYNVLMDLQNAGRSQNTGRPLSVSAARAQDEEIVRMRDQGMTWTDIAKTLPGGKTSTYCQQRYEKSVPRESWAIVRDSKLWSEEEEEQLRHLSDSGHSRKEIAAAMGKSWYSVKDKLLRLRAAQIAKSSETTQPTAKPRFWRKQETEKLLELVASQHSNIDIAKILGRSYESVRQKLGQLGGKRSRGRPCKRQH